MIKVLKNRVLLKKDQYPEKIGSIYIPKKEGQYAPPYSGTIISVGDSINDPDYVPGKRVYFHDMAGVEFEVNGEKYLSIRDNDIIAVIDE